MKFRLIRLIISLVAIIVAIVFGLRVSAEWWGTVYSAPEKPLEGASVMLLRNGQIQATVTTAVDGKFSIEAGKADPSDRVIVCMKGYEPAMIETLSPRRRATASPRGSEVTLAKDNPDFEPPFIAPLRSILPSECR